MAPDPSEKASSLDSPSGDETQAITASHSSSSNSIAVADQHSEKMGWKDQDMRKIDSNPPGPLKAADNPDDVFSHLPPEHAEILKRQVFTPDLKKGVGVIYRYASRNDLIIIAISTICGIAAGAALPLMTIIFGNLVSDLLA